MKSNLIKIGLLLLTATLLLSSCADVSTVCAEPSEMLYGFWYGIWHGGTVGLHFIGSLFSHDIAIYGINNNGGWYDFGYILGLMGFLSILIKLINLALRIIGEILKSIFG